ncbi:MAG TPA: menaquinone biosynthesis protein [Bacteroidales bacterium]
MDKIRISAVKYANTYPFIYGLIESGFEKRVILETDHPSDCAAKLLSGRVDIGLIPVAALPMLNKYYIISDYCIGANSNVRTVLLLSNSPFDKIRKIYLDYRSRSSVNLTKVLAKNSWKREFIWINTSEGFDFMNIGRDEAVVLIGDQCFEFENNFRYKIDLAGEWKQYSGLPFVFACWTANKKLDEEFIKDFNKALQLGVNNITSVVEKFGKTGTIKGKFLMTYLEENIDYDFNEEKKAGLKLFLELMAKL